MRVTVLEVFPILEYNEKSWKGSMIRPSSLKLATQTNTKQLVGFSEWSKFLIKV